MKETLADLEEKLGYQRRRWKRQRRVRDPKVIRQRRKYLMKNRAKLRMKAKKKYKEYRRNPMYKRQREIQRKEHTKRRRMAHSVTMKYLKRAAQDVHVSFQDLPKAVMSVLKLFGLRPQDIKVQSRTQFSPSEASAYGEGHRGIGVTINLETGKYNTWDSAWGMDIKDDSKQNVPMNGVVLIMQEGGTGGGKRVSYMIVNPQNMGLILQPKEVELSPQEGAALALIRHYTSAGRRDYFPRYGLGEFNPRNQYILSLRDKGLVSISGTGVKITTTGKNFAKQVHDFKEVD